MAPPTPKELSLLSHEELLPLLNQHVEWVRMEVFHQEPKDGKYPPNTLTGYVVVYLLEWSADQLYQKSSRSILMRNLKEFLLEFCNDKQSIVSILCVEQLIWWLEANYSEYISQTLNKKVTQLAPITLPETETVNIPSLLGQFKQLLYSANIDHVDEKVIEIITTHFSSRALLADSPTSAANIYHLVSNLPSTSTKLAVEKEFGIKLNVIYDPNVSDYIITGTCLGKPILVKILVGFDMEKEIAPVNHLNEDKKCPMLVPTRVCSVNLNQEVKKGHSNGIFNCLVMPHYPCSLDKMAGLLNDEDIVCGGKRMLEAIEFIHSRNMVHMDVKPANIFVSTEGDWFLGDFGSCVAYQDEIHSCSESYLPQQVIGEVADYSYDYFMLAISLLSLKFELKAMYLNNIKRIDENKVTEIVSDLQHTELKQMIQNLLFKSRTAIE